MHGSTSSCSSAAISMKRRCAPGSTPVASPSSPRSPDCDVDGRPPPTRKLKPERTSHEAATLSRRPRRPWTGDLRETRLRRTLGEAYLRHPRRDDGAELAIAVAGDALEIQHRVDLGRPAKGR